MEKCENIEAKQTNMYVKNEILNDNDVMEEVHTEGENKSVNVEIKY